MALQKVFLLPPLKGLNIYDNPFTMSQEYAVELKNFMPPTTTFTVRPGINRIMRIDGQIRGIYSYTTGTSFDYGDEWFISTIKYAAERVLLIKCVDTLGNTNIFSVDPKSNNRVQLGSIGSSYYNDDNALFKHTLFIASGDPGSAILLYHQAKGLKEFVLQIKDDGSEVIGNMQNLTIFRSWVFMAPPSSLNIYYTKTAYADILDPINSTAWRQFEGLFVAHFGKTFTLDGYVQNGGSIIKLANLSKNGSDSIDTYLTVITDQGEVLLFDGSDAPAPKESDPDEAGLKLVGRFQIPPPLNKWTFVDMEGDLIIATKNGLVSLRRIIFGQTTNVTENLEYRIMSLFKEYMFKIPAFSEFIGLYYHPRNRLLIFNVPTALPMMLKQVVETFTFNERKQIVFPAGGYLPTISPLLDFVNKYIVQYCISYSLFIELDGGTSNNSIYFKIEDTNPDDQYTKQRTLVVSFGATINGETQNFLAEDEDIVFTVADISLPYPDKKAVLAKSPIGKWNSALKKINPQNPANSIYSYLFEAKPDKDNPDYIVTNIKSIVKKFYVSNIAKTLRTIYSNERLLSYNIKVSSVFYDVLPRPYPYKSPINDFFSSSQYGGQTGTVYHYPSGSVPDVEIYVNDSGNTEVSFVKALVRSLFNIGHDSGAYTFAFGIVNNIGTAIFTTHAEIESMGQHLDLYTTVSINLSKQSVSDHRANVICDLTIKTSYSDGASTEDLYNHSYTLTGDCWDEYYPSGDQYGISSVTVTNNGGTAFNDFDIPIYSKNDAKFIYNGITNWTITDNPQANNAFSNLYNNYNFLRDTMPAGSGTYWNHTYSYLFSNWLMNEVDDSKSYMTNKDLSVIPLLNDINIVCNFESRQYVFDSHFGTWSTFEDVNMVKGIEHDNDFYFIVPNNITQTQDGFVITTSHLCKFDLDQMGDKSEDGDIVPIKVSYKTVPTFDLGMPQKKLFKRIKLFGTPSAFWQTHETESTSYPLIITPYSDFKNGQSVSFIHTFDSDAVSRKVLKKHFKNRRMSALSFSEQQKFWKLYKEENDMITQISIPLLAKPGTRFGLQMELEISEAYVDIYGFEIYFEPSGQIL